MSRRRPALLALAATAVLLALSGAALAATALSEAERGQILAAVEYLGPKGQRIVDASCIDGTRSTFDPRWAATYLTNAPSCVERYGGASGERALLRRSSAESTDWVLAGSIGSDNCSPGSGGAPNAVLRDLGCTIHFPPTKRCGRIGFAPHTEDGASGIRARGVGCRKARRIVRMVRAGDETPLGFSCEGREVHPMPAGLVYTRWVCRDGERRVSWRKY